LDCAIKEVAAITQHAIVSSIFMGCPTLHRVPAARQSRCAFPPRATPAAPVRMRVASSPGKTPS
jgi:hypothetical protein